MRAFAAALLLLVACARSSDADRFDRLLDAMQRQVLADAQAGTTRTFASEREAHQFLQSLTPVGFRPRPEYFAGLGLDTDDPAAFATQMAEYARAHPEIVERRVTAFWQRLRPLIAQIATNVRRQFPWADDPVAALAAAKEKRRATLVIFCAEWAAPCRSLDAALEDVSVQQVLDERFVVARVEMTNDAAPGVAERFHVKSAPTLIVFDREGREVDRRVEGLNAAGLKQVLERVP